MSDDTRKPDTFIAETATAVQFEKDMKEISRILDLPSPIIKQRPNELFCSFGPNIIPLTHRKPHTATQDTLAALVFGTGEQWEHLSETKTLVRKILKQYESYGVKAYFCNDDFYLTAQYDHIVHRHTPWLKDCDDEALEATLKKDIIRFIVVNCPIFADIMNIVGSNSIVTGIPYSQNEARKNPSVDVFYNGMHARIRNRTDWQRLCNSPLERTVRAAIRDDDNTIFDKLRDKTDPTTNHPLFAFFTPCWPALPADFDYTAPVSALLHAFMEAVDVVYDDVSRILYICDYALSNPVTAFFIPKGADSGTPQRIAFTYILDTYRELGEIRETLLMHKSASRYLRIADVTHDGVCFQVYADPMYTVFVHSDQAHDIISITANPPQSSALPSALDSICLNEPNVEDIGLDENGDSLFLYSNIISELPTILHTKSLENFYLKTADKLLPKTIVNVNKHKDGILFSISLHGTLSSYFCNSMRPIVLKTYFTRLLISLAIQNNSKLNAIVKACGKIRDTKISNIELNPLCVGFITKHGLSTHIYSAEEAERLFDKK